MTGGRWHGGRDGGTAGLSIGGTPPPARSGRTVLTHKQTEVAWWGPRRTEKEEGIAEVGKRRREPETRLDSSEMPWNACPVSQMSELPLLHSVPPLCLTVTLSRLDESKSEWTMHGTFGDPSPPAAKGHSRIDIPFMLCPPHYVF